MTTELFVPKAWKPRTSEQRALAFVVKTLGELSTDGLPEQAAGAITKAYERANAALLVSAAQNTDRELDS